MSHRGRALSIPEKEMVVRVKHYFDKEKELALQSQHLDVNNSALRTAWATNLSPVIGCLNWPMCLARFLDLADTVQIQ
jgi:hypothetical protein